LGRSRATRTLGALTVSALACAAVLMAYQFACFGSPFHLAYSSEIGYEGMQQGVFGVSLPKAVRLRRILFGDYRGLLPLAPTLAVAPIGLIAMLWVRLKPDTTGDAVASVAEITSTPAVSGVSQTIDPIRRRREAAIVAAAIAIYFILLNASYAY